jgi:hypothetical protein
MKVGGRMKAWEAIAQRLVSLPDFNFKTANGKACQARFKVLLTRHRQQTAELARLSGVDVEETELTAMMDDLVTLIDDYDEKQAERKAEEHERQTRLQSAGDIIRSSAVNRLKRRNENPECEHEDEGDELDRKSSTPLRKRRRRTDMVDLLETAVEEQRSDNQKTLELFMEDMRLRQQQFEATLKQHEQQRLLDEQRRREERKQDKEDLIMILKSLMHPKE